MTRMWHHRLPRGLGAASILALLIAVILNAGLAHANLSPGPEALHILGHPHSASPSPEPTPVTSIIEPPSPPSTGSGGKSVFPGDWSMLLPTIVATFLGAVLALMTAIWIARVGERRSHAREVQANKIRLRGLLDLIGRDLAWNRQELSATLLDLQSNLTTGREPILDIWQSNGPEILKASSAAAAEIVEAYGLLRRFSRLLDQYNEDISQGGTNAQNARMETLPKLHALGHETSLALDAASNCVQEETRSLT